MNAWKILLALMSGRSDKVVFYFLIVALLFNVPFAGFHAAEHLPSGASDVDAHAHHSHRHQLSVFASSHVAEEAADKQPHPDIHFCHICQLTAKLNTLIPHQVSMPQPRLSVLHGHVGAQRHTGSSVQEFVAIRGPPSAA